MKTFGSVDEALDFAISEEGKAHDFYRDLAARAAKPWMRQAFDEFAREERTHEEKLRAVKEGGRLAPAAAKVLDLELSDYLVDVEPSPGMSYREALVLAMKKEKAAYKLYSALADAATDAAVRDLFRGLATEEAKHKLRFEVEYDDEILTEG